MEKDKLFLKKAEKYHVFSSLERIKRDEKQIRFLLPKNQKLFLKMVNIHYVFLCNNRFRNIKKCDSYQYF